MGSHVPDSWASLHATKLSLSCFTLSQHEYPRLVISNCGTFSGLGIAKADAVMEPRSRRETNWRGRKEGIYSKGFFTEA